MTEDAEPNLEAQLETERAKTAQAVRLAEASKRFADSLWDECKYNRELREDCNNFALENKQANAVEAQLRSFISMLIDALVAETPELPPLPMAIARDIGVGSSTATKRANATNAAYEQLKVQRATQFLARAEHGR